MHADAMTSTKQHDLKRSKGPQKATETTSKAADTGSAARKPPREKPGRPEPASGKR
jgi:hypothetical protein